MDIDFTEADDERGKVWRGEIRCHFLFEFPSKQLGLNWHEIVTV